MSEVEITENNFEKYFFDVRRNQPQRGQIMASYTACADFVDTHMKRDIINLLKMDKAVPATRVMKNFHGATELDSIRVPLQMAEDLYAGMSEDEVAEKSYPMVVEYFFYTKKEYVPMNDPHWNIISIRNLDDFIDAEGKPTIIKSKIEGLNGSSKEQLSQESDNSD